MATELYKEISNVVHISTWSGGRCKHCDISIGVDDFEESVNHYIQEHNYKLLHVGQESVPHTGDVCFATVAVLGK